MISLDKILVLEQKIESAVEKIAQLTAENDALRSKCAELTNALSAKTEQLSAFQADQNKIEDGIIKALEQLDKISESTSGTSQVAIEEGSDDISSNEVVIETSEKENNFETEDTEIENNVSEDSSVDFSMEDFGNNIEETQVSQKNLLDEKELELCLQLKKQGLSLERISDLMKKDLSVIEESLNSFIEPKSDSEPAEVADSSENQQQTNTKFDIF